VAEDGTKTETIVMKEGTETCLTTVETAGPREAGTTIAADGTTAGTKIDGTITIHDTDATIATLMTVVIVLVVVACQLLDPARDLVLVRDLDLTRHPRRITERLLLRQDTLLFHLRLEADQLHRHPLAETTNTLRPHLAIHATARL